MHTSEYSRQRMTPASSFSFGAVSRPAKDGGLARIHSRIVALGRALVFAVACALLASTVSAAPIVFESPDTPATLIELFTSEGCSSCPPAEAWMSGLKTNPDLWKRIVPVVFHVDYWDGLGWTDRFATPENTARQRRYVAAWNGDSVYTPGLVLNGREWRGWFENRSLPKPLSAIVGRLKLTVDDQATEVAFTSAGGASKPSVALAEVAFLAGNLESDVTRGENRGRKLQHDFTVVQIASAPMRAEGGVWRATIPRAKKLAIAPEAIAAWISPGEAQPPIQATGGWLHAH
jgi:hypothetical protein